MPENKERNFRKSLGDSLFSLSVLDLGWPNYKNSRIFILGQNTKFKFVLPWY